MSETSPIIEVGHVVPVRRLSELLEVPVVKVIQILMGYGVRVTINESVDYDTAAIVADELGITIQPQATAESVQAEEGEAPNQQTRPPVVTIMGHVDHGKTKLLDTIRKTNVVASETGGITQHIGAYQVDLKDDAGKSRAITFLDTPGHEAFSAMRAHGANITDIVVLVVAADDGVKPQTLEAVSHAKAANVPIIAAITKIDKPEADIERTKRQLADIDLLPEEWGGKTVVAPLSSVTGEGVRELLDLILLTADVVDYTASPTAKPNGVVIESHLAPGLGPVATVLVQQGTLKIGSVLVFQTTYAKIRSMENHLGKRVMEVGPSTPVRIAGLKAVPEFGEIFKTVENEKIAREMTETATLHRNIRSVKQLGLGELSEAIAEGTLKELAIVIKADTQGSLEAIRNSVLELSSADVAIKIVHEGVGDVSESDVNMAISTHALVVSFRVAVSPVIRKYAAQKAVKISSYDIIYQLIDDLFDALAGLLEPELVEVELGKAEVLKVFKASKNDGIVGVRITSGVVEKGSEARIVRNGETVGTAKLVRIQREKDVVDKVNAGTECGISLDATLVPKEGDQLELFKQEERIRKLERKTSHPQ
jgi:translation initiation factor IF-2